MAVLVSIVCNAFNHEKYIADALESFVKQKTNFEFEVLVYDDASPDNTAQIIRQYEEKYPDIIKPVYQTVNQYSRGLMPEWQNIGRATGKYIAMCEGDDYWLDENKLQKQIDYMEAHPDCSFCFTNGYVDCDGELLTDRPIIPWDPNAVIKKDSSDYNAGEVELIGYIPTCSFMFRRENGFVPVAEGSFKGDAYMKLSATSFGYAHYMDERAVAYRRGVAESETASWGRDVNRYARMCDAFIKLYDSIREPTEHKYDDVFNMRVCQWEIIKYFTLEDYEALKKIAKSGRLKYLRKANFYSQLTYSAKCRIPKVFHGVRKLGKKIVTSLNR